MASYCYMPLGPKREENKGAFFLQGFFTNVYFFRDRHEGYPGDIKFTSSLGKRLSFGYLNSTCMDSMWKEQGFIVVTLNSSGRRGSSGINHVSETFPTNHHALPTR